MARLMCALALMACDPGFRLYGSVVDARGVPLPGVKVALVCYGADQGSVMTDVKGMYSYSRVGAFGNNCEIQVRFRDEVALAFDLLKYCIKTHVRQTCVEVRIDVKLDRAIQP